MPGSLHPQDCPAAVLPAGAAPHAPRAAGGTCEVGPAGRSSCWQRSRLERGAQRGKAEVLVQGTRGVKCAATPHASPLLLPPSLTTQGKEGVKDALREMNTYCISREDVDFITGGSLCS